MVLQDYYNDIVVDGPGDDLYFEPEFDEPDMDVSYETVEMEMEMDFNFEMDFEMKVQLRDPNIIMKLSRLGSFHQSRLSFLRSFLDEFKEWEYKNDLFDLDENGFGTAIYSFKKKERVYSLICFANKINDKERSDRVIATKWDAAFTLHDGVPSKS